MVMKRQKTGMSDSLIIATGSNLGNKTENLKKAVISLSEKFKLIAASGIYHSKTVGFSGWPDFHNQVLEFEAPNMSPEEILEILMKMEFQTGRQRGVLRGPRLIDLDILFIGLNHVKSENLEIPHPRLFERSFVVLPLMELPYYEVLKKHFDFPDKFSNRADKIK